jgi:hypothetical protein
MKTLSDIIFVTVPVLLVSISSLLLGFEVCKDIASTELRNYTKEVTALVETEKEEIGRLQNTLSEAKEELLWTTMALGTSCFIPQMVHVMYPCAKVPLFSGATIGAPTALLIFDTGRGFQRIFVK